MKDKKLLDTIYKYTHIKNEDGEDVPFFCFVNDIITELELDMSEEELAQTAVDSGYKAFKVFPGETFPGGLLICDAECGVAPIEKMYDEFYGEVPEIEIWPEEELEEAKGGLAKGLTVEDIAKKHGVKPEDIEAQIKMGLKVEVEHTDSLEKARRIAMDHLTEIPDYYTRLAKMEKGAKVKEELLDEKKKKTKKKISVSDPNAKAMWTRTRHKVEKPKKGKGSFSRRKKHINEDVGTPSDALIAEFREQLTQDNMFTIVSEEILHKEYSTVDFVRIHMVSTASDFNLDNYRPRVIPYVQRLLVFGSNKKFKISYSFGLHPEVGNVTAYIDAEEQELDPDDMVDLETGERIGDMKKRNTTNEDIDGDEFDSIEVSDEPVEVTTYSQENERISYKQKITMNALSLGASIEIYDDISPNRQDSVWYDDCVALIRYEDYSIQVVAFGYVRIMHTLEDGTTETFYGPAELENIGIETDDDLRVAIGNDTINLYDNNWFEFNIIKEGSEALSSYDLGFDVDFDIDSALDIKFYIDEVIPAYNEYVAANNGQVNESSGKPSKNDLKKAAKRHKRTDKKGAKGWFVKLNAGNVPHNINFFNNAVSGSTGNMTTASASGISAPAGLGEDVEGDEFDNIEVSDEPVKLRTIPAQFTFNPLSDYVVWNRWNRRYPETHIPPTALRVDRKTYNTNPFIMKNKRLVRGITKFFNDNPRYRFCVIEYLVPFGNKMVKKSVADQLHINEGIINSELQLDETIEKHDTLNPKLWEGNKLKPEVEEKIRLIVDTFIEGLREDEIKFTAKDILLIGSNASYNYTDQSDLDVHILANTKRLECPDKLYSLLYSAYRSIFNKKYDIEFYGINVELYVDTEETTTVSNGIYSLNKGWIKEPVQADIPDFDEEKFNSVFYKWEDRYFDIIGGEDIPEEKPIEQPAESVITESVESEKIDDIDDFIEDIYDLRKFAISKEGEYSIGNLIFKEMRNLGYLDNLKTLKAQLKSKELSLTEGAKKITRYAYEGPVFRFSRIVIEKANLVTTANSPSEAIKNIKAQAAKKLGLDISSGINLEINAQDVYPIEATGDEETPKETKCPKCSGKLNDAGECPACDLGDESALEEELNTDSINTKEKLAEFAKKAGEDGTFSVDDKGNLTKTDITSGKQVSFFRPEITNEEIKLVLDTIGTSFGEPYLGLYQSGSEISFTLESSMAKEVARIFNQKSVWNNETKQEEPNMSYDESAKVDYKKAVTDLAELLAK